MKFLTLNTDVNGPSLDPVGAKWPAHEGIKDGYPIEVILPLSAVRDRLHPLASKNETL